MDIFDRIRELCKERNITIHALEVQLGFSNKSLYPRSDDSTIRGDRVAQLAKYFGVSTDYLLTGEENGLTDEERRMILTFRLLNKEGKTNVIQFVDFMYANPLYKKSDLSEVV